MAADRPALKDVCPDEYELVARNNARVMRDSGLRRYPVECRVCCDGEWMSRRDQVCLWCDRSPEEIRDAHELREVRGGR